MVIETIIRYKNGLECYSEIDRSAFKRALISLISFSFILSIIPGALAGCACSGGGVWDPSGFLNYDPVAPAIVSSGADAGSSTQAQPEFDYRSATFPAGEIIKALPSVSSSDLVVDISDGDDRGYIRGAFRISPSSLLNEDGSLRSPQELSGVLGAAGLSAGDPVVVYGSDVGNAAFGLWVMKYLGQEKVSILDGDFQRWSAARLPVDNATTQREKKNYTSSGTSDLLASYDDVSSSFNAASSSFQVVDARPFQQFARDGISHARNIDYNRVIDGDRIAGKDRLEQTFDGLDKSKPVAVYSSKYTQAATLWLALTVMGYDAKIYPWDDWLAHQAEGEQGASTNGQNLATTSTTTQSGNGRYKQLGRSSAV